MSDEIPAIDHRDFVFFLMVHLLRSRTVLEKAGHVVEGSDFYRQGEERYQLLWTASKAFWDSNRRPITREVLLMDIETRLGEDPDYLDEAEWGQLGQDIESIYAFPADAMVPQWVLSQLQSFIMDRRMRGPARAMADAMPETLDTRLRELIEVHASSQISTGRLVDSFRPGRARLVQAPRTRTGVEFVDELLGGGIKGGDVYGLLGPAGKGKTTLAVQTTWNSVMHGIESAYFAYETPFEPEYTTRFYGYMADIPAERIMNRNLDALNPDDRQRILDSIDRFGNRFHPIDMVGEGSIGVGCGGVDEVRSQLRTLQDQGHPIQLAVIDQHLPQVDRYLAAHPSKMDRREMMQKSVDDYMKVANELNVAFLLIHQLNPTDATKPAYAKPDWGCAAECKSWAFWMTNCLALGNHDRDSRCWLISSKARGARLQELIIRMLGDRFRFEYEEGRYRCTSRKFIDTQDQEDNSGTRAVAASTGYTAEGRDVL